MTTAIPVSRNKLSCHFSKSEQFILQHPVDKQLKQFENPANQDGCSGKSALLEQLQQHQVEKILVSQIGNRMLGRLLDAGFRVFQIAESARQVSPETLFERDDHIELTTASQGKNCPTFEKKHAEGKGKCCSHAGHKHHGQHGAVMHPERKRCAGKGSCCGKQH